MSYNESLWRDPRMWIVNGFVYEKINGMLRLDVTVGSENGRKIVVPLRPDEYCGALSGTLQFFVSDDDKRLVFLDVHGNDVGDGVGFEDCVEILNCPFCGSVPHIYATLTPTREEFSVDCSNEECIAHGIKNVSEFLEIAAARWNERVRVEEI